MSSCIGEFAADDPTAGARLRAASRDRDASRPLYADSPMDTRLRRRISSRLASCLPLDVRRLDNAAPLVSFTFDDVPESAHSRGAAMLEARRARGTYYVATALVGRRSADWTVIDRDGIADLHERGHEIGLHMHEHREVGTFSGVEFRASLEKNRAELQRIHPGIEPQNFAYPFGAAAFARKRQLAGLARSSRSVKPGINAGLFDAQFVKCVELADARLTREKLDFYLDAVVSQKGWLVFLTHDVSPSPSRFGCSIGLFERALDGAAARGVEMATVADALRHSRPVGWPRRLGAVWPRHAR
jgi:peptidoglycan/xylan/chitin deacetylase (PgdA/CDA1 family)